MYTKATVLLVGIVQIRNKHRSGNAELNVKVDRTLDISLMEEVTLERLVHAILLQMDVLMITNITISMHIVLSKVNSYKVCDNR